MSRVNYQTEYLNYHKLKDCLFFSRNLVIEEQEITQAIHNDAKNLDRLAERCYCRDFSRLGLGSLLHISKSRNDLFRLTLVNTSYAVCKR